MSTLSLKQRVPRFLLPAVATLAVVTLVYSLVVSQTVLLWLALWGGLVSIALVLFVVYLFYRLVLAVERIAAGR